MINIVLLGCPGAGKGTLAKQLEDNFNYSVLTTGAMYRKEAELKTKLGLCAKEYWSKGNLCPDEMTNELIKVSIKRTDNNKIIFDGYPRNISQAKFLDSIINIDLIFDISVSDNISISRLLHRSSIENRQDDTEEIIKQRLKVYHSNNKNMVEYYKINKRYKKVNGEGSPENTLDLVAQMILDYAWNTTGD